jgi:hypothetical protein
MNKKPYKCVCPEFIPKKIKKKKYSFVENYRSYYLSCVVVGFFVLPKFFTMNLHNIYNQEKNIT